jgi:Protein of unknown function (DUF732)
MLDNHGVYYSNISDMIDLGKVVCRIVRQGGTRESVDVANAALTRVGYTAQMDRAVIIITAAANHLCPDIGPILQAHNNIVYAEQHAPPPAPDPAPDPAPPPPAPG